MKLYIDTSQRGKSLASLDNDTEKVEHASQTLKSIEKLLKKKKVSVYSIKSIEVCPNGTSFTGLRLGMAISQALAWSLGVKLNGKDISGEKDAPKIDY